MIEPLKPEAREALKEANPGLTDQELDRFEELLIERLRLDEDSAEERARAQALDQEREALVRQRMPNYRQVMDLVMQRERASGALLSADEPPAKVDIVIKSGPR